MTKDEIVEYIKNMEDNGHMYGELRESDYKVIHDSLGFQCWLLRKRFDELILAIKKELRLNK